MPQKIFYLSSLALALAVNAVHAQIPAASQQVDSLEQRRQLASVSSLLIVPNPVPEFYEGETSDVGPQSVLKLKPRRTYIEASADEQFFFSDNVFLGDQRKQGADVLVSTVSAALAPTPFEFAGGQLSPRLGYQHQWFNYGLLASGTVHVYPSFKYVPLDTFDFNVSTIFSDVAWRCQNWTFTLGGDYRRLLDSGSYNEFYHELVPRWAVQRDFQLCESVAVAVRYEGDYRFTQSAPPAALHPSSPKFTAAFNDRTDQSLAVIGSWRICRHAVLQPFYRFQFSHFTQIQRDDFLNSFGLALIFPLTAQISVRTFVSYDLATTDGFYVQDYQKLDAGGGVNLTIRF